MNTSDILATGAVLVIDDDPAIQLLMERILRTIGLSMISANNGEEGLAKARETKVKLVLLDNEMPGMNGLEVLREMKQDFALASLPVIMVTGNENNRLLSECFSAGAADYLRKPFAVAEARTRISSVLERQRLLLELTQAARYDRLTGLANRALLTDRLTAAVARVQAKPQFGFALMFLDFDRFKLVNDTLGHDVGDMLLQAIAGRLLHNVRATETGGREAGTTTVARLGGDEFVILLDGVQTIEAAEAIGTRLLLALDRPYQLDAHTVHSTASIGTVLSAPEYTTADDMLRDADIAMYEAKARGKACQVVFNDNMRLAVRERVELESALRNALSKSQMSVTFQPIVALDREGACGLEASCKWTHPTLGEIEPSSFIPLAEEAGLILAISEFVLREACAGFTRWKPSMPSLQYLSINLSRMQFTDPEFVNRTLRVLQECGMSSDQLQVEVSESHIAQYRMAALPMLNEFHARGVRLALEDFGSSLCSLSWLRDLPLDAIKIDSSLITNASTSREYAALLHAVMTLADNLDVEVIAQGVETAEQLVLLQALGCSYAQGTYLSAPLSAEDLARSVNTNSLPVFSSERTAA